jgi:hypothetical protein
MFASLFLFTLPVRCASLSECVRLVCLVLQARTGITDSIGSLACGSCLAVELCLALFAPLSDLHGAAIQQAGLDIVSVEA